MEREPINSHQDLRVYKMAFDTALKIFDMKLPSSLNSMTVRQNLPKLKRGSSLLFIVAT